MLGPAPWPIAALARAAQAERDGRVAAAARVATVVRYAGPMKPSVGRIVHFYAPAKENPDGNPFAALVTAVWSGPEAADDVVDLVTFGPGSIYFHTRVRPRVDADAGGWEWPPRT